MDKWESVIKEMENKNYTTEDRQLELLNYYYGYIGYLIGSNQNKKATGYIQKGEKIIDNILKNNPDQIEATAYKGTFTGFKISMDKVKSVTLGPKSLKYINKAYKLDPNNVQAISDKANMLYYAPSMFGGDKEQAFELYKKAIRTIEKQNKTAQNWNYLNLLLGVANHYKQQGKTSEASAFYNKILQQEPNFSGSYEVVYDNITL